MDNDEFGQSYSSSGTTCVICNIYPKDTTENPNSQFCSECREKQIRYPVPKWIWAVLVLIAVALVFASSRMPALLKDFKLYKAAETSFNQGYYNTAANTFQKISEENQNKTLINEFLFLSLFKAQRFDEASDVFNNYLADKKLSDSNYEEIVIYRDMLEKYYLTGEKLDGILSSVAETDTAEDLRATITTLQGNSNYDQALVYYYLSWFSETTEDYENWIQLAYDTQPRYTYLLTYLGNAQRNQGNIEQASATYNKALSSNRDDEGANRGLGIICLLAGDKVKGLSYIEKAYNDNPNGIYVVDTYAVALKENGRLDEAMSIYDQVVKSEYYMSDPTFEAYFAGTGSLEAMFLS